VGEGSGLGDGSRSVKQMRISEFGLRNKNFMKDLIPRSPFRIPQ
jgi:hypothetical protein